MQGQWNTPLKSCTTSQQISQKEGKIHPVFSHDYCLKFTQCFESSDLLNLETDAYTHWQK